MRPAVAYVRDGVRYDANPENAVRYTSSPEGDAGLFGRLFMTWLTPLILVGYRRRLEVQDALPLRKRDDPTVLYAIFEREWGKELAKQEVGASSEPSVIHAMWRVFRWRVGQSFFWKTISIALELSLPIVLHRLITFLESSQKLNSSTPIDEGMYMVAALAALQFAYALIQAHCMYMIKLVGVGIRGTMMTAIYRACLQLSQALMLTQNTGKMVNQLSADANLFVNIMPGLMNLWGAPIQILTGIGILWYIVGPEILVGFVVMIISVPLFRSLKKKMVRAQKAKMKSGDQRLKLTHESLQGIKVLKLYAWETVFRSSIDHARSQEAAKLLSFAYIKAMVIIVFTMFFIVFTMSIVVFIW